MPVYGVQMATSACVFNRLIPNHRLFTPQKEEVTDWRKNVESMSGMEGRKKLFDAGQ